MSEEVPTVTFPLTECPLSLLSGREEEYAHFMRTYAPILRAFPQITPDSYWRLTVAEHELMWQAVENG